MSLPKELETHQNRAGLILGADRKYVVAGHSLVVETDTSGGIGATDKTYGKAGAAIFGSAREVSASSKMIPSSTHLRNPIHFPSLHLAPIRARPKVPYQVVATMAVLGNDFDSPIGARKAPRYMSNQCFISSLRS